MLTLEPIEIYLVGIFILCVLIQGPKWPLFYSHLDPVWSLCMVETGYIPWVELPIQRRLCPIFMSGVG